MAGASGAAKAGRDQPCTEASGDEAQRGMSRGLPHIGQKGSLRLVGGVVTPGKTTSDAGCSGQFGRFPEDGSRAATSAGGLPRSGGMETSMGGFLMTSSRTVTSRKLIGETAAGGAHMPDQEAVSTVPYAHRADEAGQEGVRPVVALRGAARVRERPGGPAAGRNPGADISSLSGWTPDRLRQLHLGAVMHHHLRLPRRWALAADRKSVV